MRFTSSFSSFSTPALPTTNRAPSTFPRGSPRFSTSLRRASSSFSIASSSRICRSIASTSSASSGAAASVSSSSGTLTPYSFCGAGKAANWLRISSRSTREGFLEADCNSPGVAGVNGVAGVSITHTPTQTPRTAPVAGVIPSKPVPASSRRVVAPSPLPAWRGVGVACRASWFLASSITTSYG